MSNGWGRGALRLLIDNAAVTKPDREYVFETGETKPVKRALSLDQHASRCKKAHEVLALAQAVLDDAREQERAVVQEARNQVVLCEGDLMKAELALKSAQDEYSAAASEIPGVPVK